jgi:hypothetical protein
MTTSPRNTPSRSLESRSIATVACRRRCERWLKAGLKNGWNEFNERQKSSLKKRASKEVF